MIDSKEFIETRLENQLKYFDDAALKNQKAYRKLKKTSIFCNVLTTMTIALAFTVPEEFKIYMGILSLILSTIVLATYQWEEFQNHGAKWEKFRLVAEQLKAEKIFHETKTGRYKELSEDEAFSTLVEVVESVIKGTDISYFTLMVEPGKRIEKRLENNNSL